jgi:sterol desaturase/sphingolipid hydroxylase (fatty acid hydroxylase superfamily)
MHDSLRLLQSLRTGSNLAILFGLLAWETAAPFLPLFRDNSRGRIGHAWRNLFLGLLNALLTAGGMAALWGLAATWSAEHHYGLLRWVALPGWAEVPAAVILFDCWMYLWHRANHRLPFLWRFHRTHHSDPRMDVTTAHRFHFGEILFSSLLRVPVIVLLGMGLKELVIYEALMFTVVQLHHANIGLGAKLDKWLRWVIVTPAMHKVHHSRIQHETDSNYSSFLSIWDRIFGTLVLREAPETIQFGLADFDAPERHTVPGMLKTPL